MLQEFRDSIRIRHIRENLPLILSSLAFMALNLQRDPQRIAAFPAAVIMIVLLYSMTPGIMVAYRKTKAGIRIYAALSAAGTALYAQQSFVSRTRNALGSETGVTLLVVLSAVAAVLSLAALHVLMTLLLSRAAEALAPLARGMTGTEKAVFALTTAGLMIYAGYTFIRSSAFWGPGVSYEVIYTSDSPSMMEPNVFLWLYHPENDLRQPLFAVFSAPLTAPAYLLSLPFSGIGPVVTPLMMNLIQIPLLTTANLMLAGMSGIGRKNRIFLMIITSVTYPTLLFSVMIEQYIVAYFWLIFAVYCRTEKGKTPAVAAAAAGGTLLTSLALMPLVYRADTDGKGAKAFLRTTAKAAFGFLGLFIAFGRLDTLMGFGKKAGILASFAGGGSFASRLNQYLSFAASCFAAPDAAARIASHGSPSWQLTGQNMLRPDYAGAAILALCIISLIVNRREAAARIAGAWAGFSVLLLLIVGWGAPENGMILYTLYFGWAFWVLSFMLTERIAEKARAGLLTPAVSCTIIAVLVWLNYRGIGELLRFAVSSYPNIP